MLHDKPPSIIEGFLDAPSDYMNYHHMKFLFQNVASIHQIVNDKTK